MAKLAISVVVFLAAAGAAFAQSTSPQSTMPSSSSAAPQHFTTQQAAQSHCPTDTVVWATLTRAKAYHLSGDRYYGKTKRGAYMCQQEATKAGLHQVGRRSAASPGASSPTSK